MGLDCFRLCGLGACRELAPSNQESTTYEPSLVCKLLILGCRPLIPDRLLAGLTGLASRTRQVSFLGLSAPLERDRWIDRLAPAISVEPEQAHELIFDSFPGHLRLVKLLSYLELCFSHWTRHGGVGKEWLFRLAAEWSQHCRQCEFRYGETDSFGGNILTECYWISLRIIRTISYREECRRFRWADSSRKSSSLQPRAFS